MKLRKEKLFLSVNTETKKKFDQHPINKKKKLNKNRASFFYVVKYLNYSTSIADTGQASAASLTQSMLSATADSST